MTERPQNIASVLPLAIGVACLDYAAARTANALGIPFYLDTWATSVGVLAGGLVPGILGGALYCAAMVASVWGLGGIVWALSSASVALLTWTFARRGWIDVERPLGLLNAGIATGALNTLLSAVLEPLAYGSRNPFDKSLLFRELFRENWSSWDIALHLDSLLVEIMDKTVCIIVAAAIATLLLEPHRETRRSPATKSNLPRRAW
jgi:hypothetical protein